MNRERFIERQLSAKESVGRLVEAVSLEKSDIVRDAVIQRFEFTFEAVWKCLQIFLEHQGHECPGSRTVIRKAYAERLISCPDEADIWFQMVEDRNLTSHAYDEELSEHIYANIVAKYVPLLRAMSAKIQTLEWA